MTNLAVIIICLLIGLLLQKLPRLPLNSAASLNLYVVYVALPALILTEIPRLTLDRQAIFTVVFAWLIMTVSALITWSTARILRWPRAVTGALMLTVPLGNTSFVGIPLISALLGNEAVPYAILYDQFGTFLALNTYGIICAAYYSGGSTSWSQLLKTIASFPPFIALLFAFFSLGWNYSAWLSGALVQISSTLVPVVMVAVGLQWQLRLDREFLLPWTIGLVYMLVLTPALALSVFWIIGLSGPIVKVIILQAAMPAMISAGLLAMSYNLSPRLASALISYSLLFSLLTVWLWRVFLMG